MKHTYLFPLEPGEQWLWRAARMDATDLFGMPEAEADQPLWVMHCRVADAIGEARDELHHRLKGRDRICIGRRYVIPGSLDEGAQSREAEAGETVRLVTMWTWDAPVLEGATLSRLRGKLNRLTDAEGMSGRAERMAFLNANEGRRIVPVWM